MQLLSSEGVVLESLTQLKPGLVHSVTLVLMAEEGTKD